MSVPAAGVGAESLIARCLLDAGFLRDAAADPSAALAERNISTEALPELEALDLARVRLFAGFVTKVQHNHLWECLPYTRAMMKRQGVEIEAFATFHPRHLTLRASGASRAERIDAFIEFLDGYAASRELPAIRDVLRHERILIELPRRLVEMNGEPARPAEPAAGGARFAALVPVARGALLVAGFEHDPLELAERVNRGAPIEVASPRPVQLAYCATPEDRRIRILEVDELTAALLARIDGLRSVRAIAGAVAGAASTRVSLAPLRPIFDAAVDAGLIAFRSP